MLTVEIVLTANGSLGEEVEIYFDREGIEYLVYRLQHILDAKTDHISLMSESWGLGDLDEIKHRDNNRIAHHLRMTLMDEQALGPD